MRVSFFFTLFLFIPISISAHTVFIVVHGTWAAQSAWFQAGGDFFDTLEKSAKTINAHVVSYVWSGKNNYESRVQAAKGLVKLIQSYPVDTYINLVTHSHGSNVGILASQFLAKDCINKHKIDVFYALATPVQTTSYFPDMNTIRYFYHLFSFADLVQPVIGLFDRQYPQHERIANIRVTIENKEPQHSALHDPIIAHWLPYLHEKLMLQTLHTNQPIIFTHPGIIHFFANHPPRYEIDTHRADLLKQSDVINQFLANSLLRAHKYSHKILRYKNKSESNSRI